MKKVFKVKKDFPYDVRLRLLVHNRRFLADQKVRNAIVGAENLLSLVIKTNVASSEVVGLCNIVSQ